MAPLTVNLRRTAAASCAKLRLASLGLLLLPLFAPPAGANDLDLLQEGGPPPNVVLFVDTSGSMRQIMYHPALDSSQSTCPIFGKIPPNAGGPSGGLGDLADQNGDPTPWKCTISTCQFGIDPAVAGFVATGTVSCPSGGSEQSGYVTRTFCGKTRNLYADGRDACEAPNNDDWLGNTWYEEPYLEWLFSPAADPYFLGNESNTSTDVNMVDANENGTDYYDGTSYPLYKRSRMTAAREVARDVIYQTNANCGPGQGPSCTDFKDDIRFGIARFQGRMNGGYVSAEVDDYSVNKALLEAGIDSLWADTSTPLAEALFKLYTYLMSRSSLERPFGKDGVTLFPQYAYKLTDGNYTTSPPACPLECPGTGAPCACQRNFVIMLTDGQSTRDDFTVDKSHSQGFADFEPKLIGDYNPDGEVETGYPARGTRYLDDIALFMQTNDFRPDLEGTQLVDVYTVGFHLDPSLPAGELLTKTAAVGNGQAFFGTQEEEIRDALMASIGDISLKSTFSFTAPSVPSSRTADGASFFYSDFRAVGSEPFWAGTLFAYAVDSSGAVVDTGGNPIVSATTGLLDTSAPSYWEAGALLQTNTSRTLYATKSGSRVTFNTSNVGQPELQTDIADIALYPNYPASGVDTLAELDTAIVDYVHGRDAFDEDGDADSTELRAAVLGDIFHSTLVVIGTPPGSLMQEDGFGSPPGSSFYDLYKTRDRVLYVGANDGMLHAFHSGDWQTVPGPEVPVPPAYDHGTGAELFGYVPGQLLDKLQMMPRNVPRSTSYVDGELTVADAWFDLNSDNAKTPDEWATMLVTGFREGGPGYLALDVTDPTASAGPHGPYPKLQWEFSHALLGESWSKPVITRVKVEGSPGSGDNCGYDDGDGDCREQWVAIFGGGYREDGNPNNAAYVSDPANAAWSDASKAIFMVALDTGALLASASFDATDSSSNGLGNMKYSLPSSPAVLQLDSDDFADVVYIGDLGGQLWKWDLSSVGADTVGDFQLDNWPAGVFFRTDPENMGAGVFHYRSLFHAPGASLVGGKLVLAFGTGERQDLLYPGDTSLDENNRFYVVKDLNPTGASAFSVVEGEANLDEVSSLGVDPDPSNSGFYFVAGDSEKFVTEVVLFAGQVIVASYKPAAGPATCTSTDAGEAFLYIFDIASGLGFFTDPPSQNRRMLLGGGLPSSPKVSLAPDPADDLLYI